MKYFKITNLNTNENFFMAAARSLDDHTMHATFHALNLQKHFNPAHKYSIEEVSFREYCGFSSRKDYDSDNDWDDDDGWENFQ